MASKYGNRNSRLASLPFSWPERVYCFCSAKAFTKVIWKLQSVPRAVATASALARAACFSESTRSLPLSVLTSLSHGGFSYIVNSHRTPAPLETKCFRPITMPKSWSRCRRAHTSLLACPLRRKREEFYSSGGQNDATNLERYDQLRTREHSGRCLLGHA